MRKNREGRLADAFQHCKGASTARGHAEPRPSVMPARGGIHRYRFMPFAELWMPEQVRHDEDGNDLGRSRTVTPG
jgi:hypothetical protein